ncbi:MAG TPA: S1/P1 nuclease [Pseudoxanthomonas sp.]|nr:S1/P1 nuclease [Pseudoxanthomonas sp.]
MTRFVLLFSLAALLTLAPAALAWGDLGHRMVGDLAARQLTPAARTEVARLLAGEPEPTLGGVANWADDLRNTDPERFKATSRWHYINAKGGGCAFDIARDCPDGNCVVAAIEAQRKILADRSQPQAARRDALKFIVHLVGDVHQPMHAGNRTDAGGNKFQVSLRTDIAPEAYARNNYVDGVMGTNLHSVWDYYILASRRLPAKRYAKLLAAQPVPSAGGTTPLEWAEASCRIIDQRQLYPAEHKMDRSYLDAMRPLAEQRVREAGLHLARLLNQTLDPGAK